MNPPTKKPSAIRLRTILVPTDFSEASKEALPYAVALARQFGAGITLIYVVPTTVPAELRHIGIVLTRKGVDAVRRTSVLESQRLQAALSRLSSSDLSAVIAGLETLARACRRGRSKSAG
jgi:nucleotide-binding universal stress UspA family protein